MKRRQHPTLRENTDLPGLLGQIAEATDRETALVFAQRFGGRRVDMPRSWPDNWLTEAVGETKARRIVDAIGHGRIDIPLGPAGSYAQLRRDLNRRYRELEDAGGSEASIARDLGITERAVRYRRAQERDRGPDLFGPGPETLPGRK